VWWEGRCNWLFRYWIFGGRHSGDGFFEGGVRIVYIEGVMIECVLIVIIKSRLRLCLVVDITAVFT
jgi:hypothetical protein